MMQKCGNCIWHDDNAICKNPDAFMEGCVMDDLSWCVKYKRKKAEGCADRKDGTGGPINERVRSAYEKS